MTSSTAIAEAAAAALMAAPGAAMAGYTAGTASPMFGSGGMMMANAPGVFAQNLAISDTNQARGVGGPAGRGFSGDTIVRNPAFTQPRTITLSSKFDGAVSCDIWSGYAMMLVSKSGKRRVVQGPQTVLLEYDEHPQILALSRGKPKTTDNILRTAYLLTTGNKVSDIVEVETSDFCKLRVKVSYRVNFEGEDTEQWFAIENYTKFLTDHLRSKLRSATKKVSVQEFYGSAEDFVRDTILGKTSANGRLGTRFEENGMHVYDVEVLGVDLDNKEIATDLANSQKEVIKHALMLQTQKRALEFTKESETIKQQQAEAVSETARLQLELRKRELGAKKDLDLATLEANSEVLENKAQLELDTEKARVEVEAIGLAAAKTRAEQDLAIEASKLEQKKDWLRTEAQAFIDQHKALDANLAAALSAFGERELIEKAAEALAPLSIIKGSGAMELLAKFLDGTNLAKHLGEVGKNGTAAKATQPRA
jgi:major vault protein